MLVEALKDDNAHIGPNARKALKEILKVLPETENDAADVKIAREALAKQTK